MSLPVYTTAPDRRLGQVLGDVLASSFSFGTVTLKAATGSPVDLVAGTVLGFRLFGAPTIAAEVGNTGNGAAGAVTLAVHAMAGGYTLRCVSAAANGGTFAVFAPAGGRLADLTVGQPYNGHFAVTIADGSADFIVGDSFTVTVPDGDGKAVPLDLDATDGTAVAAAILAENSQVPVGADQFATAVTGFAHVKPGGLIWPAGITDGQKAYALRRLADRFITPRQEA